MKDSEKILKWVGWTYDGLWWYGPTGKRSDVIPPRLDMNFFEKYVIPELIDGDNRVKIHIDVMNSEVAIFGKFGHYICSSDNKDLNTAWKEALLKLMEV